MTTRAHRAALAGIVFLGALLFIIPIVRREVFVFRDHLVYFLPLRFHTAAELRAGHLPLWNPYNASGEPWLANPQTAVFYPPAWLFLILPFPTAYMVFLMFHVVVTGCGAYLLFSRTGRSAGGTPLIGAVALMFCGPTLSLLDVSNNLTTFAWMPLILWLALVRADDAGPTLSRPRAGPTLPLSVDALALALAFLGGEPFFAAFAAFSYAVILALARRYKEIAAVAAIAFALCAVQLLPFIEWLHGTNRGFDFAANAAARDTLSAADWLRIAIPPHVSREGEPLLVQQYIPMPYAGFFVPAAAILGLIVAARRRRHVAAGWLALIAVSVILASSRILDLVRARYPARMMSIAMIGIVGLAVIGWDAIRPQRVWLDWIVAIIIAVELVPRAMPLLHTIPASELAGPLDPSIGRTEQILRLPVGVSAMTDPPAWLFGYQNLYARRFDTGSGSPAVPIDYLQLFQAATRGPRIDLINLLSAGYIFCDRPLPLPGIARVRGVTVYRNAGALPMARFAAGSRIYSATISRIDGTSAEAMINAPADGVLTIAQRDAPGWTVSVDGEPRPKLVAFGVFRAVALRPGAHRIVWRYRPATLRIGFFITIAGLVWLVADVRRSTTA